MQDPPRSPNESIISRDILFNIAYVAIFMAIGTLWTFVRASEVGGLTYSRTMTFTTMAMFQVFNALNCRSRTRSIFQIKPGSNKYLLVAIAVSVALQFAATRVPLLQNALDTHPLSWADWGAIVLTASSVLVADEVRKLVQRRYRARHAAEHGRA
jgi:Ca2+-transporting ATPase